MKKSATGFGSGMEELETREVPAALNLVAASYFDSALYELNVNTGAVLRTLIAPNSQATLQGASGVAIGGDGNVYLSSRFNNSIVKYNVTSGALTTFISGATAASGLTFDPDGDLYVSLDAGSVVRYDLNTSAAGAITYAGTRTTVASGLTNPSALAFGVSAADLNTLYVGNSGAGTVLKVARADSAAPGAATVFARSSSLNYPSGLTWGADGSLYVTDLGATTGVGQVLRFSGAGVLDSSYRAPASTLTSQFPVSVVFTPSGTMLTANLGPTYPAAFGGPGTSGSIYEFSGSTFVRNFTAASFPAAGNGVTNLSASALTLDAGNVAPRFVGAAGSYTLLAGQPLTLGASATDADGNALTYSWDVNGDGTFGDAVGASPTLSWAQLNALGITGAGTFAVRVAVSDGHSHVTTAAATLAVRGDAPAGGPVVSSATATVEPAAPGFITVRNADGSPRFNFAPYQGYTGPVTTALGDVTGDGIADIVTTTGRGFAPHVKVFDGATGAELRSFLAYAPGFLGGVNLTVGDVNRDGKADIVTATAAGASPHVKVFDGASGAELRSFLAYAAGYLGGVNVALGDITGDGVVDIVTSTTPGSAPHVKVFDGRTGAEARSFLAYAPDYRGGVNVALGDTDGDGRADIITAANVGGGASHVKVFDGATGTEKASFIRGATPV